MKATPHLLKSKIPFNCVHEEVLTELCKSSVMQFYRRGEVIFDYGSNDNKTAYLAIGKVKLVAPDGRNPQILYSHEKKAAQPLTTIKPRLFSAIAESSDTCVIWLHERIIEHVLKKYRGYAENDSNFTVDEFDNLQDFFAAGVPLTAEPKR